MAGDFIWYELITPDPDGARVFYEKVVDGWAFDATGETLPNGSEYRMIKRSDAKEEGGVLRLSEGMAAEGARPCWAGYVAVDDVDRAIAAIKGDGGQDYMEPIDLEGVGRFAMVADPWGAFLYVMTPAPPPGSADAGSDSFDPQKAQHVRWNELASDDQDGAIAFYAKHFGWTQEGGIPMGDMGEYKFINHGGTMIGAIMQRPPEIPASAWCYYIGVADIDAAAEAIRAGGGTVMVEPMEIPGGEFSLNAMDPQGAVFGLVGPRK